MSFVRPNKKDSVNYRTEDDLKKLEASTNRQPNLEILDHERKRKIEVKCAELEETLESQGWVVVVVRRTNFSTEILTMTKDLRVFSQYNACLSELLRLIIW